MPKLKSFEGKLVGRCVLVEEPGPKDGRRTTHWCRCVKTGNRLPNPVKKDAIQQALKHDREICPFCRRPYRASRRIRIGDSIAGIKVKVRVENGQYPGGQGYDRWLVECPCARPQPFIVNGDELRRALDRDRLTLFSCSQNCINMVRPDSRGFWELVGPAKHPINKGTAQERWWRVRCTALCRSGRQCGNERVKSTSDLHKKNASKHCGCLTPSMVQERHARTRKSDVDIGIQKLLKDYKRAHNPAYFQIAFEDAKRLLLAPCTYCGRQPFQKTEVETYAGQGRRIAFDPIIHGGIDRVVPNTNYLKGNAVSACKTCNWFKARDELQEFADRIRRVFERREQSLALATRMTVLPKRTGRLENNQQTFCHATYRYIMNHLYRGKKQAAKIEGWEFELSFESFELLSHDPCKYCGREPSSKFSCHGKYGPKRSCRGNCPPTFYYHGMDRVNNDMGYVAGNSVASCRSCNVGKKNFTVEQFIEHIGLLIPQIGSWPERIEAWTGSRIELS
jgi:Zn-finger protein